MKEELGWGEVEVLQVKSAVKLLCTISSQVCMYILHGSL